MHDVDTLWMCPKAQSCGLEDSLKETDFGEHLRNAHHIVDRYHMRTIFRCLGSPHAPGTSRCFISTCGEDCNNLDELGKHISECHSEATWQIYWIARWNWSPGVSGFCLICNTDIFGWDGLSFTEHLKKHDRSTLLEFKDRILSESRGRWNVNIRELRELFERLE